MNIVQVSLQVPDDIYADVLKGKLEISGLVKDNKNIIRKHLSRAKQRNSKENKVKKGSIIQVIKDHRGVAVGITIATAIGGCVYYAINSSKEKKAEEIELCVARFQKSLKEYLKAAKKGKLNAKVIDNLIDSLKELETNKIGDTVMLSIPADQLNELISSIFEYTQELAKANSVDIQVKKPKSGAKNNIVNLQSYLEVQKQIVKGVA